MRRTVLIRIPDVPADGVLVPHREVTEEAIPWCETHGLPWIVDEWSPGDITTKDECIWWYTVGASIGAQEPCRLEDPPTHWKEATDDDTD
jgi:hypothetical protein